MDELCRCKIGVGDIVRVKNESWWISVGANEWTDHLVTIGGISVYGVHYRSLGKLKIVRQVTDDGLCLSDSADEYNAEIVLFPFEMIEDNLRNVSMSEMRKMSEMLGSLWESKYREEYADKMKQAEVIWWQKLRTQWIWCSDGSMPENMTKVNTDNGCYMSADVVVICADGTMVNARRYRIHDDDEWEWLPQIKSKPLYWLLTPEKPEMPFGGKIADVADSWRYRLTRFLLKIGLIR